MDGALRPLRVPGFGRLALVRVVDEVGNWLGEVALAVLVFDRTGSALATAALFLALQFAPALVTPPLVARLEALPSRIMLPALNVGQAVVYVCLAGLAGDFALGPVVVLAAVGGLLAISCRTLTRATAAALLLPAGLLTEGNAILNVAFTTGVALGPAIAGLVVAAAGPRTALFADAGSFVAVAVLLATTAALPRAAPQGVPWRARLRDGIAYVSAQPVLRLLLTAEGAALVFFAAVIPIEVVFAKRTLGAGDAGYGLLLASWGVGMVIGSLVFAGLRRAPLAILLGAGTLAVGCAYLGTAVAPTLLVACLAAGVGGMGNGIEWVAVMTCVQQLTSAEYQARAISLLESLAAAMPGLGFILGGAVATLLSPRASYAVAGAGVLIVLAIAAIALQRAGWPGELVGREAASDAEPDAASPRMPEWTTVGTPKT
jgi:MFS family permease